jgi:hypothetical protein
MELLFPVLSAFALGAPSLAGIGLTVAAILVFVSHEALLVLLGRRGEAQRVAAGPSARRLLAGLLGVAALTGLPALVSLSPEARLAVLAPLALGAPALLVAVRGLHERTLPVELLVALALSSLALPVGIDAGLPMGRAALVVLTWTVAFAIGTFGARGVLYRAKDAGRGLVRARAVGAVTLLAGASLVVAAVLGGPPEGWLGAATLPWSLAAIGLGTWPPSPRHMTAIGVSLVVASSASLAVLVLAPW